MNKSQDRYRTLNLVNHAKLVSHDVKSRGSTEEFQDMLVALALRCKAESFTTEDLLSYLGEPDRVEQTEQEEIWEYDWMNEHCSVTYRSTTPFVLKNNQVIGLRRDRITPRSF